MIESQRCGELISRSPAGRRCSPAALEHVKDIKLLPSSACVQITFSRRFQSDLLEKLKWVREVSPSDVGSYLLAVVKFCSINSHTLLYMNVYVVFKDTLSDAFKASSFIVHAYTTVYACIVLR